MLDGEILFVNHTRKANRAGNLWLAPGYRYNATGRHISAAKVGFTALPPQQLRERRLGLVGGERRS